MCLWVYIRVCVCICLCTGPSALELTAIGEDRKETSGHRLLESSIVEGVHRREDAALALRCGNGKRKGCGIKTLKR